MFYCYPIRAGCKRRREALSSHPHIYIVIISLSHPPPPPPPPPQSQDVNSVLAPLQVTEVIIHKKRLIQKLPVLEEPLLQRKGSEVCEGRTDYMRNLVDPVYDHILLAPL